MYAEIMALPSTLRPRYARDLLVFTRMVNGARLATGEHNPRSYFGLPRNIAAKPMPRCA